MESPRFPWLKLLFGGLILMCLACILMVLPMLGIGGNQVEHAYVSFDVHPDGKHIVFSSGAGDLYVLDLTARKVKRLTNTPRIETGPRYAPNGSTIIFSAENEFNGVSLFEMPSAGGPEKRLTRDNSSDSGASFSADGRTILYTRASRYRAYSMGGMVWDAFDLYVLDLATLKTQPVTHERYYSAGPAAFAKNGTDIIFAAEGHGAALSSRTYRVAADGKSKPRAFMPVPAGTQVKGSWASGLRVSRSGNLIAFISDRKEDFAYDVYVGDADGSHVRALGLTQVSRYNQSPVFAPDEKSVYTLAGVERNAQSRPIFSLYRIDFKGKATRIADSSLFTDPKTWSGK